MEILKKAMEREKLSQADLAEASGVTQGAISHLVNGLVLGRIRTWLRLAKALKLVLCLADLATLERKGLAARNNGLAAKERDEKRYYQGRAEAYAEIINLIKEGAL